MRIWSGRGDLLPRRVEWLAIPGERPVAAAEPEPIAVLDIHDIEVGGRVDATTFFYKPATAGLMAIALVDERLAACVNMLPGVRSVYRWQAGVETAQEWPLMIKTTDARLPALKEALQALHPYEVPELIALTVVDGLPAYLAWAREACAESAPDVAGEAGAPR